MSGPNPQEMAERHQRALAELAELNLDAARQLHGRLASAETNAEARDLALALQRVSRSVRQTLLLEAKLARELRNAEREAAVEAEAAQEALVKVRKARVRHEVGRVAVEAGETEEDAEQILSDLDDRLDGYVRAHDFETAPLDELVLAICKTLGFSFDEPEPEEPEADGGLEFDAAPDSS